MDKSICVIGGGISGLVTAFLLKRKGFRVELYEKSNFVGGNIQTIKKNGFLIEHGPNSLLKSSRLVDLIKELNLETEVLPANPAAKKRYVLQNGKVRALPTSLFSFVKNDFFSVGAKLRLLKEPFIKSKSSENESVAEFFERRLGAEIVRKAADPFVAGIFAGKAENLSVRAAFPRLFEMERDHESLFFGAIRSKTEKTDKNFPRSFTFKNGVQTLTDKLAEILENIVHTDAEVSSISKTADGKFSVKTKRDGEKIFDAVVLSTGAHPAANLIENLDANLAERLKNVYYPPIAVVCAGIKKENIGFNLDGFGFLIPSAEKRRILGTLWNSAVFEERAPAGYDLLTTFVGGSRDPEMFEKSAAELEEIVFEELRDILGLKAKPEFFHIKRWAKAIPQYNIGYEKVLESIENFEQTARGVFFCSNFYRGISVGDCVKNAYKTAEEIASFLNN